MLTDQRRIWIGGAIVLAVAGIGAGVLHQAEAMARTDEKGDQPAAHDAGVHAGNVHERETAKWFGHRRIGESHNGLLRYDRHASVWTVAFADRFDLAPWDYFGYAFQHEGNGLDQTVRYNGVLKLEPTAEGVMIIGGDVRLLVDWAHVPAADPLVELRRFMRGEHQLGAMGPDIRAVPEDLDNENCPGGWCWCTGPQGPGHACCEDGQEPFCECTGQHSLGGCRKKPDGDARVTLIDM
jgi:hypothetical protein